MGSASAIAGQLGSPPLLDLLQTHRSKLATYALEDAWVDKDPRLCITYPAYFHILLRRIPLVVALRDPLVVATSLHSRNGFSLNRGLVLWWIYNHHIASQLCAKDLLVTYRSLLTLDVQELQRLLGPFLELHNLLRPSDDHARHLIASLLKPEFNRAETTLNTQSFARINPLLLKICEHAYRSVTQSGDHLTSFQEQFASLPRPVLECSARDQLLLEAQASSLQIRFHLVQSEFAMLALCWIGDRDCDLLRNQLTGSQELTVVGRLPLLSVHLLAFCVGRYYEKDLY